MTKKTWIMSATVVIIVSVFVATTLSNTVILDFIATSPTNSINTTQETRVMDNPWQKDTDTLTTKLSYETPAGLETNSVTLTIDANNSITDFHMTIDTTNDVSIAYQEKFIPELSQLLIGKQISELKNIDTIAGASLTTQAFNEAVTQLSM